ncbi:hypothetical protein T265_02005 [Opisthorchis viverrini]|uniref:Tudor domain-containing protein n=1 Tax=Opisthorchis viverrini TaxID=6198 RepID=A0A075AIK0_OPIVI|nr:hypothetical protein T265_02005 [Opisthorchis viverrini]KER31769.1 hypothetical protein T265_02005 [Opisthorchis viverrini]
MFCFRNVRELKNIWQAEFSLNTCPGRQDTLIFRLSCPVKHKDDVLRWVARRFRMRPSKTPIGNPNQLKRYLPLGEPVPVHVRSLYASKEFFVTIQDDEYSRYLKLQAELDSDYNTVNNFRVQLCEPVTSGTVAVVPHSQGFARALIISVHSTWPKTVFYFLLDHGTFGVVALNKLRKIRWKPVVELLSLLANPTHPLTPLAGFWTFSLTPVTVGFIWPSPLHYILIDNHG